MKLKVHNNNKQISNLCRFQRLWLIFELIFLLSYIEACSHGRSHQYYAESILNSKSFTAYPCHSYEEYNTGKCKKENGIHMGDATPNTARGIYYLKTSDSSPYSQGRKKW